MDSHRDSARYKLEQILQDLASKAEESQYVAEEDEGLKGSPSDNDAMPPPTTPSKRSGRAPRKRRKKDLVADEFSEVSKPSYVLKLFDRSVDMAQFRKDTSMYAMCRSWALNKPSANYEIGNLIKRDPEQDEFEMLYSVASFASKETGEDSLSLKPAHSIDHLEQVIDAVRDFSIIQKDNIARWRQVRERWRQASFKTQEKHVASLKQLKSLFTQP